MFAGFKPDQTTTDIGVLVGIYFLMVLLALLLFFLRLPRQRSSPGGGWWRRWGKRRRQRHAPAPAGPMPASTYTTGRWTEAGGRQDSAAEAEADGKQAAQGHKHRL